MRRRGIFGGTFDPPHYGHLSLANCCADKIPLDIVHWVPARTPPHKDSSGISPTEHRVAMVMLAIAGNPRFELSRIELSSDQPPWTVFLLERFAREFPDDELHLIIGGDSLAEIHTWRDYRRLWTLAQIDVVARSGWDASAVAEEIFEQVNIVECPSVDISATEIRARISRGESIDRLVPPAVRDYIIENDLYGHS
ncbi:MAG TPA: nicotinate (nicotinamide) nucleotide adenylyltransferase [candidate division Zixibacteria bacterium]|nr:nicotinate (nicotinamide) nucleotide adenylyltransferase [candidate division Zixibacteria bacterium]